VCIEEALATVSQITPETIVAGRTDAGVHATGQVIHVDLPETLSLDDLVYKLNRLLDQDIRVHKISIAPEAFHARFSALRRYYRYKILDENKVLDPLARLDVETWYRPLDLDVMNKTSALLLGEHDFAAFCKYREGATTIRTLEKYEWKRSPDGFLVADIVADAFCYSMVRNLVGAVVCVADGRFDPEWIEGVLNNKERVSDSLVFPGRGLTLYQVDYPNDVELLERAKKTIARRNEENN
jgi:tRNA pseudouridine38-40 synthase